MDRARLWRAWPPVPLPEEAHDRTPVGHRWVRGDVTTSLKQHRNRGTLSDPRGRYFVPPPGEVGPGQDGLSGPWANFEGAKMACSGRGKVIGGQLRLGDQLAWGGGRRKKLTAEEKNEPRSNPLRAVSRMKITGPLMSGMVGASAPAGCVILEAVAAIRRETGNMEIELTPSASGL